MAVIDIVAIGGLLIFALIGIIVGFGRGLKFFTKGIFGVIIGIIVTYFVYGIVMSWEFVQQIMTKFSSVLPDTFRVNVWVPSVVAAIVLFLIIQIIRIIIVSIIKHVAEAKNPVMKTINKVFGLILFAGIFIFLFLLVFQIGAWANITSLEAEIVKSKIGLNWLYEHNPLNAMWAMWKNILPQTPETPETPEGFFGLLSLIK